MQRKSDRRSSPCQGHRERLRADLGRLRGSLEGLRAKAAARFNGCDGATRRSAAISMFTLWVLLGPLKVTPFELLTRTTIVIWQASTLKVINPGRGGKP